MQHQENRRQEERIDSLVDAMRRQNELLNVEDITTLLDANKAPVHVNSISKNTIIILSMAFTVSVVAAILHFALPGTPNTSHTLNRAGFINTDAPASTEQIINNDEKDKKATAVNIYKTADVGKNVEIVENRALSLNPQELNYLDIELNNDGIWFQTMKGTMCYNQDGMICIPNKKESNTSHMVVAMSDNMVNPAYTIPFESNLKANDVFIPVEVSNHEGAINCSAIFWYRPSDFYQAFPPTVKTDVESKRPRACGIATPNNNFSNSEIYKILYPQQSVNRPDIVYDTVKPKNIKPVDWGKIDRQMKAIDSQLRIVNEQLKEEGKVYNQHMREYQQKMDSFSRKMNQMQPYMNQRFKRVMNDTQINFNGAFPSMNFKWTGDSLFGNCNKVIILRDGNSTTFEIPEVPEVPEMPEMPNIVIPNLPEMPDMKDMEKGYKYYYYYDMKKGKVKKKKIKQHKSKEGAIEQEINIKY